MRTLKTVSIAFAIVLICACSHPIEISGKGDVKSASGNRDCYLENFEQGKSNCKINMVTGAYQETYYAVARQGWQFDKWLNYCTDAITNQCSFNIPAELVQKNQGVTVPPLVAVFTRNVADPTPKPTPEPIPVSAGIAVYSYQLDSNGNLVNPLPLEGASLKRKVVYFSYSGNYAQVNFWCCKVSGGSEAHLAKFNDTSAPFIVEIDLTRLAKDFGRKRELYADIYHSNGYFESDNFAYWTLEPLPEPANYKVTATGQIYSSGDTEFIPIGTSYTLEWTYYNYARAEGYDDGVCTDSKVCEYMNNGDPQGALRDLTLTIANAEYTSATLQTHGLDPISIEKDNASTGDWVQMGVGELSTETSFTFTGSLSS
ncbi:MAG: hypothetical protein QNL05_02345, partial [Gammaproteobacteria bacterium]|nr:hypothetical protein [Gammaproteobacteria bacterium]